MTFFSGRRDVVDHVQLGGFPRFASLHKARLSIRNRSHGGVFNLLLNDGKSIRNAFLKKATLALASVFIDRQ